MRIGEFRKAGHLPSLLAALAQFDVSFVCWVLLGPLAIYVSEDLGLSPAQKGLMVAIPLLSAAVFRVLLGVLSDRYGPRRVGIWQLAALTIPLLWAWRGAGTLPEVYAIGVLLGIAGASFAVALPLASRWYPPRYQGLVMGVAAAGNTGTVVAALGAPRLAEQIGWHATFGVALIPVALILLAFLLVVKEPPLPEAVRSMTLRERFAVMAERDAWRFCGFYLVTFGGFVGLASFLPILFHDEYGMSKVAAGTLTGVAAACGSFIRPVGGWLSDRHGGSRVLGVAYVGLFAGLVVVTTMPPLAVAAVAFPLTMAALGVGNGAVFQMIGIRFSDRIGSITGIVGAAGGVGGFMLPTLLGAARELIGSYGAGFAVLAAGAVVAVVGVTLARRTWHGSGGWGRLAEVPV